MLHEAVMNKLLRTLCSFNARRQVAFPVDASAGGFVDERIVRVVTDEWRRFVFAFIVCISVFSEIVFLAKPGKPVFVRRRCRSSCLRRVLILLSTNIGPTVIFLRDQHSFTTRHNRVWGERGKLRVQSRQFSWAVIDIKLARSYACER